MLVAMLLGVATAGHALALCGDLDTSDSVTAPDALICLQGAVSLIDLTGSCAPAANCGPVFPPCGDITGDGVVTTSDCFLVLAAAVKISDISTSCDCEGIELCGNHVVDGVEGEKCDDGNVEDGDGCSAACQDEDVCAGVAATAGTSITTEVFATGLHQPLYVTAPPGDVRRVHVVQQNGLVLEYLDGVLQAEPFLDLSAKVQFLDCCNEEGGLLSIAFHPDYATSGRFFVNYTRSTDDSTVISRFEVDPETGRADPVSETQLLAIGQDDPYHNGGQLQFGPDGYLYIGMGDGNGDPGGDLNGRAQNDFTVLGKMLRADVDVDDSPPIAPAPDNPNAGLGLTRGLHWAKGLRNPWRFSFDRETGDMYIADVGQADLEEIDFQPAASSGGENYGWNFYEGSSCFPATACPDPAAFTAPVYEYAPPGNPSSGASVTGGYVYRGCALPDLHGTYFYADFIELFVRSFEVVGGVATAHTDWTADVDPPGALTIDAVASFGEDARGEIYIVDYYDGEIFKIVPAP